MPNLINRWRHCYCSARWHILSQTNRKCVPVLLFGKATEWENIRCDRLRTCSLKNARYLHRDGNVMHWIDNYLSPPMSTYAIPLFICVIIRLDHFQLIPQLEPEEIPTGKHTAVRKTPMPYIWINTDIRTMAWCIYYIPTLCTHTHAHTYTLTHTYRYIYIYTAQHTNAHRYVFTNNAYRIMWGAPSPRGECDAG